MRGRLLLQLVLHGSFQFAAIAQMNGHWRFGSNAGVDFSSGTAVPVLGNCFANECSASISNENGELLMYTNGQQVWNRNGGLMDAGTGLLGSPSSTQTLIVPQPGNCNRFYIFTTTDIDGDQKFRSTVVDLCMSQGLGNVIFSEKNVVLYPHTTEAIVAIPHANGVDIWVIAFSFLETILLETKFHAFLLSAQGINTIPVTSIAGSQFNPSQVIDQLEGSHNGNQLVHIASGKCDLLDFDPATGIVYNGQDLGAQFGYIEGGYDAVFSPDDTKLYITTYGWTTTLRQLDLESNVSTVLGTLPVESGGYGGIQLGPDGKVYVARIFRSFLDVINAPNLPGTACGHVDQGLPMPRSCWLGLPSALTADRFRSMAPKLKPDLGPDVTVCPGVTVEFDVEQPCSATVQWSNGSQTQHTEILAPDTIVVQVHAACAIGSDTLIVHAIPTDRDQPFQFPNVFTPNGDGINDTWRPGPGSDGKVTFIIHDRWGKTVFESTGAQDHWDGRRADDRSPAADGVYYYICTVGREDPCSSSTERQQGHLTLLR